MSVATAQDNGARLSKPSQDVELIALTGRQAIFWQHYKKTGNAAEAARRLGVKPSAARTCGCQMLARIKKKLRIDPSQVQQEIAESAKTFAPVTKQMVQQDLRENREKALETNQVREANQATLLLGKTIGLFQDGPPPGVNVAILNDPVIAGGVLSRITDGEEITADADD